MTAPETGLRPEDQQVITIRPPAALAGRRCVDCDTRVSSPRVEAAPGVCYCVYCAEAGRHIIMEHYPTAAVVFGELSFHLGTSTREGQ